MKKARKLIKKKKALIAIFSFILIAFSITTYSFLEIQKSRNIRLLKFYYSVFPQQRERYLSKIDTFQLVKQKTDLLTAIRIVGAKKIMQKLISDSGGGSKKDCHQQAHVIGRAAYELNGAKAFQDGDFGCHSGFYHGAMEAFLRLHGTENLVTNIKNLCDGFKTYFSRFECYHGIGHGLLAYENYDLPQTLADCKKFSDDFTRSSCYGGTFMENIIAAAGRGIGNEYHSTAWVSQDPYFPCNKIDQSYDVQYQCYQMQTSWMLTLRKYDFEKVSQDCLDAPTQMRGACFKSFGRDVAGYVLRDPIKILHMCSAVPSHYDYEQCIIGGLNVIVDFWGPSLKNQGKDFCNRVNNIARDSCFATLETREKHLLNPIQ